MIRICETAGLDPQNWLARHRGKKPLFACILSFTETALIPQISAAGTSPRARRYTALADGEYLYQGTAQNPKDRRYPLPVLPAGISPAVLTRAMLSHCKIPLCLLSTGLPAALTVPHISLPTVLARALSTGAAMTLAQAETLFDSGYQQGKRLMAACSSGELAAGGYLVLGESVVGGTTTAQAVLAALGYEVAGQMSSSHPRANHAQKQSLVEEGLNRWRDHAAPADISHLAPISAAAAVGDPMQLVAAGIMLSASCSVGVLLAGGSQMLAVYALARAIAHQKNIVWNPSQIVVGTTRWVIEDTSADTVAIAQAIGAPYLASQLSFARSPYVQLRAYERGFVKEGTGAGGCAIAAHLYKNCTNDQLRHAVEAELRQQ